MTEPRLKYDITADDLSAFANTGPAFVTIGETMVRETAGDRQRPENSNQVYLSLAGSEFNLAVLLARFGVPAAYITRIPDNPHGWRLRNVARAHGVDVDHLVWAPSTEPMGRYIYDLGRTPRRSVGWYQRMYSAASRLEASAVDWQAALRHCRLFHVAGITFGLAEHSSYERNYLREAFEAAMAARPEGCLVGLDFNYRSTLWSREACKAVLTPLIEQYVDVLITSVHDMATFYDIGCGQYSAADIRSGEFAELTDDDLRAFASRVRERFDTRVVATTMRRIYTMEDNGWEAMAATCDDGFYRSAAVRPVTLVDRLGGGDAWAAGFYYGLLTAGITDEGIEKGVLVGDAAARLQQTLMFDLPVLNREEVADLMRADLSGDMRPSR